MPSAWPLVRMRPLRSGGFSCQIDLGKDSNGRRTREHCQDRSAALAKADWYAEQRKKLGTDAERLTPEEIHEYIHCRDKLAAVGATMSAATEHYLKHAAPYGNSRNLAEMIGEL